ncbi:dihydroorotase [Lewinella aquimaris]|uniref:Dihydroorotase n=1 Tax=Neolewinella aquimaris TaxID=1835722 RepID=A0A840E5K5_9BACT|nr:dihydroorotase [Neolewinella aquimaris]MBB4078447.1 dihydroorotase [Neolewinella aquimaris]
MLLRSVSITDTHSPHHGKTQDVRIANGRIEAIADEISARDGEEVFSHEGARLSPGFVDIGAYLGDPGHEEREDIASLTAAAAAGGYVAVAVLPTTDPVRQSVADMTYLASHNGSSAVDLLPLAALSRDNAGKDLTEMMELAAAGALAFTDGPGRSAPGNLLKRGLEYAKSFGGTIIDSPYDTDLAEDGQVHEGGVSVSLGLRGIPVMTETIPLARDLTILSYTHGRLLLHLISSADSLQLIQEYRDGGGDRLVGCTVSAHHLTFTEESLSGFDPNFKLLPPLRETTDREALRNGVLEGRIEAIVSHHRARHGEEKDLEFSYSAFGARGLETALRQLLSWADTDEKLERVIAALTVGPRRLLGLPPLSVAEGNPAQLTLFTTEGSSTFTVDQLRGKTTNSPLLGLELPGRILATVNNDRLWTLA